MRSATYIYGGTKMDLYQHSTALSAIKIEVTVFLTAQFGRCAPTLQRNMQDTPTRMKTVSSLKMLVPPT